MKRQSIAVLLLLCAGQLAFAASGQGITSKEVEATYAADRKLCADETDSGARMQCLRDAKAEYTKGLAATKASQAPVNKASSGKAECRDCGRVLAVNVVEKKGEGSALGLIAGGVAGGLLGNQIGSGRGKTLATVAGAAGGAYAGKQVEGHVNTSRVWSVRVRFDNGQEHAYEFGQQPQFAAGDRVRKSGESIAHR